VKDPTSDGKNIHSFIQYFNIPLLGRRRFSLQSFPGVVAPFPEDNLPNKGANGRWQPLVAPTR
jgi:hypothetical protein